MTFIPLGFFHLVSESSSIKAGSGAEGGNKEVSKVDSKVREMGNSPGTGLGPKPAVHEEVSPEPERQVLGDRSTMEVGI